MIDVKNVITIRLPFPDIDSGLALKSHMYICVDKDEDGYVFAKSQTDTPSARNSMKDYIEEEADIERNPFHHSSLIDCDKFFRVSNCNISDKLITQRRPDVSDELFETIISKYPDITIEEINTDELKQLNSQIT